MFPLGEIPKTKVREIAEQIGLPNAKKKDSTGICFIGERPFRDFLNRYLPTKPGPMKTTDGKIVGEHIGLAFYTFGQRKGIGLGGSRSGSGEPWFVAGKDIPSNTLYVAQGHDHSWLLSHTLPVGGPPTRPPKTSRVGRKRATGRPTRPAHSAQRSKQTATSRSISKMRSGLSHRGNRPCSTMARSVWAAASSNMRLPHNRPCGSRRPLRFSPRGKKPNESGNE
jgi:hypothetical protein